MLKKKIYKLLNYHEKKNSRHRAVGFGLHRYLDGRGANPERELANPLVNRVNVEAPRSDFFAFESTELAQKNDKKKSSRYLSLGGCGSSTL